MANIAELRPGSYEYFAQQEFYRNVDRALLEKAPTARRVVDLATGTGAIIQQLEELGKITSSSRIVGIDIDERALQDARKKFDDRENILFVRGTAESVSIQDESVDLVTVCNSIHLMNPSLVFAESNRILIPGGLLLVNTAYEKTKATPQPTPRIWGTVVSLARREAEAKYGITNIPSPIDLLNYKESDYVEMAQNAGFEDINVESHVVDMDRVAIKAICDYEGFAEGALPGVRVDLARKLLVNAVDPMFERMRSTFEKLGKEAVPRTWMFLEARKGKATTVFRSRSQSENLIENLKQRNV